MPPMRGLVAIAALLGACALLVSGCGEAKKAEAAPPAPKPHCAHPVGWQKLANRIHAPVYCPGWLPDPLTGQIGSQDNNINSVSADRSSCRRYCITLPAVSGGATCSETV